VCKSPGDLLIDKHAAELLPGYIRNINLAEV
jgi:hypothetical protein